MGDFPLLEGRDVVRLQRVRRGGQDRHHASRSPEEAPGFPRQLGKPIVSDERERAALPWESEHIGGYSRRWYRRRGRGRAVADILFGDYNRRGSSLSHFTDRIEDIPPFESYGMEDARTAISGGSPSIRSGTD